MKNKSIIFEDHTADIAVWIYAKTINELLNNIINSIFIILTGNKENKITDININSKIKYLVKEIDIDFSKFTNKNTFEKEIKKAIEELKLKIFEFIEEIIYLFDTEYIIARESEIKNNKVIIKGEAANNYKIITYIKAITLNEFILKYEKINENNKIFKLHLVFDV